LLDLYVFSPFYSSDTKRQEKLFCSSLHESILLMAGFTLFSAAQLQSWGCKAYVDW